MTRLPLPIAQLLLQRLIPLAQILERVVRLSERSSRVCVQGATFRPSACITELWHPLHLMYVDLLCNGPQLQLHEVQAREAWLDKARGTLVAELSTVGPRKGAAKQPSSGYLAWALAETSRTHTWRLGYAALGLKAGPQRDRGIRQLHEKLALVACPKVGLRTLARGLALAPKDASVIQGLPVLLEPEKSLRSRVAREFVDFLTQSPMPEVGDPPPSKREERLLSYRLPAGVKVRSTPEGELEVVAQVSLKEVTLPEQRHVLETLPHKARTAAMQNALAGMTFREVCAPVDLAALITKADLWRICAKRDLGAAVEPLVVKAQEIAKLREMSKKRLCDLTPEDKALLLAALQDGAI